LSGTAATFVRHRQYICQALPEHLLGTAATHHKHHCYMYQPPCTICQALPLR